MTNERRSPFRQGKDLPLLLETPRFLIVNKPPGLAVHPGPSTTDCVEACLVPHPRGGPWLAHRLDADTAGCLLIARRKSALLAAQQAFQTRHFRKLYWAIVCGSPPGERGTITANLRRHSDRNGWRMVEAEDGLSAQTQWRVLGRRNGLTWLELDLLTGRTHQARFHCAALGTPILGDSLYGSASRPRSSDPLHLLARSLDVTLAEGTLRAKAPPPTHMARILAHLS